MAQSPMMTSDELIERFERADIAAESFHHADHVELAFAYLQKYPVLQALEKFISALQRFATAKGKAQLYNETITYAYFFLIRERITRFGSVSWDDFCWKNPDLLVWRDGILNRYYCESTLKSDLARRVFVLPDKFRETSKSP